MYADYTRPQLTFLALVPWVDRIISMSGPWMYLMTKIPREKLVHEPDWTDHEPNWTDHEPDWRDCNRTQCHSSPLSSSLNPSLVSAGALPPPPNSVFAPRKYSPVIYAQYHSPGEEAAEVPFRSTSHAAQQLNYHTCSRSYPQG